MEYKDLPILSVLAQPTRWRAFALLIMHGQDGMVQGEIARSLSIEKNLMSTHLKIMREAGLVAARREGRKVTYIATPAATRHVAQRIVELIDREAALA